MVTPGVGRRQIYLFVDDEAQLRKEGCSRWSGMFLVQGHRACGRGGDEKFQSCARSRCGWQGLCYRNWCKQRTVGVVAVRNTSPSVVSPLTLRSSKLIANVIKCVHVNAHRLEVLHDAERLAVGGKYARL